MKTTVTCQKFLDSFRRYDRANQFSRAGLVALFVYLEELERETGEEYELDVYDLCCNFMQFRTVEDAAWEYGWTPEHGNSPLEWLQEQTDVIEIRGYPQVIVKSFLSRINSI
jgi:hypothetical protein